MTSEVPAVSWLAPLAAAIPELTPEDWARLRAFEADLADRACTAPSHTANQPLRSRWLLETRRRLASRHSTTNGGRPVRDALWQTLAQFTCGFYDLDLRDAWGPGHGALILDAAIEPVRRYWAARIAAGDLVGIAATERHGGSRVQEITTSARLTVGRQWVVSGEKCWVSRLAEAAGIVIFFRDPDGNISAAIVDADRPGLERELVDVAGLAGWSWGTLCLHDVSIDPHRDLLGRPGQGLALFRHHFARFRPLVAATALGAAAGVHVSVAATLAARVRIGLLPRVRDNALITLGRVHAELTGALLSAVAAVRLAALGDPAADLHARIGKAYAVDTAHRAATDLAPLIGAAGYQAASPIVKVRRDLSGFLYADGIHDSLYRSGGISLLPQPTKTAVAATAARAELDRAA